MTRGTTVCWKIDSIANHAWPMRAGNEVRLTTTSELGRRRFFRSRQTPTRTRTCALSSRAFRTVLWTLTSKLLSFMSHPQILGFVMDACRSLDTACPAQISGKNLWAESQLQLSERALSMKWISLV